MISQPMIYKSPIQHLENLKFFINNNYKITEIKTKYIEREKGNSAIKLNHLFLYMIDFIRSVFTK